MEDFGDAATPFGLALAPFTGGLSLLFTEGFSQGGAFFKDTGKYFNDEIGLQEFASNRVDKFIPGGKTLQEKYGFDLNPFN